MEWHGLDARRDHPHAPNDRIEVAALERIHDRRTLGEVEVKGLLGVKLGLLLDGREDP